MVDKKPIYFLNKVVVITGASSGIGRTLAYWYLNNGSRVAVVGRDVVELDKIGKQYPAQCIAIQCDLAVDIQLLHLKQAVIERFGTIDILLHCAGKIKSLTFKANCIVVMWKQRSRKTTTIFWMST